MLRLVEILGIEQARAWGVCTMNEFRKFLGLKRSFLSHFEFLIFLGVRLNYGNRVCDVRGVESGP